MRKLWGLGFVAVAACQQPSCVPEGLGADGLPDVLKMTIDGPVTVAPGEESAPVRVRMVCPRCDIDWSPWDFVLVDPSDGTPGQGARFEPAYADWEAQLRVLGNVDAPRGDQPQHVVRLKRRQPIAGGQNLSSAYANVDITVTGGAFELVPRPAALDLDRLGIITVEVKREPGFTDPVQVQLVEVAPVRADVPRITVEAEPLDDGPTDLARFLVRETDDTPDEFVARFIAQAGNTRRQVSVPITRPSGTAPQALTVVTTPTSVLLRQGGTVSMTVTAQRRNGFSGALDFSVAGLPDGVTASFDPASVPVGIATVTSTMTLMAARTAAVTITRPSAIVSSGAVVAEYRFQLTIPGPPRDAGPEEVFDGGEEDGGADDAGSADAGSVDAGFDGGSPDAGAPDAGAPDAGPPPAGPNRIACECLGGLGTVRVCSAQSCLGSIDLETFCDGVCGDAGVLTLPSCVTDSPLCVAPVVDAGPVDAGAPPGGGANLLTCDCLLGGARTVCANENCAGTGQLYTYCTDVCGGSSLASPPMCSSASPVCFGSVGDGGLVVFDAGFEGTNFVECGLADGGYRPLCTNVSCRGSAALTFLALRCQSEFGLGPLPRSCMSDALQCGGSGSPSLGNAFSCRCSDGRLIGSCYSIGECTVAPGIFANHCNEVCLENQATALACEGSAPFCPAGTSFFTVDAGGDAGVDAGLPPWDVVQLSASWTHICARTDGGSVWCWGQNPRLSPAPFNLSRPTQVEGLPPVVDIASTAFATCALTLDGEVLCFGGNDSALNLNTLPDGGSYGVRTVDSGMRFEDLTGSGSIMCGLNRDGGLFCWGGNTTAALGRGFTSTEERAPDRPDGGSAWTFVAPGSTHTCGLDQQRRAWCWGQQTPTTSQSAVAVDGGRTFELLTAGAQHTCGIEASTSRAMCWGSNSSSQLGVPPVTASLTTPAYVDGGRAFVGLSAGGGFTCGVTDGGSAYCWGVNNTGQLGIGTSTAANYSYPQFVSTVRKFTAITSGNAFTCALDDALRVWCWGTNINGALGRPPGMPNAAVIPVEVIR